MTSHSHYPPELDTDSVTSSPRSDHFHDPPPRVRFMCSFGGKILPRPHDNQLRYVGGDTRIVAVHRSISFSALILKLSKLSGMSNITAKYQLPNEDLDALISVTTDEDVENMMDEYDRVAHNQNPRSARLRLFLFPEGEVNSRASSISSLLNGSANRENWFLDALNGGVSGLERGRSEASSMVSEVPDYLFGLDNSEETTHHHREPRPKDRPVILDNVSASDPGSPAPVVSSPFCSTSSAPCVPSIPNLPPVKTKPVNPVPDTDSKENQSEPETVGHSQPNPYPSNNPVVQFPPETAYSGHPVQPVPVFYVPGPVQPGSVPVQPVPLHAHAPYPYVQQPYHAMMPSQVPLGYHHMVPGSGQVYGTGMRHVTPVHHYNPSGLKQQVYQAVPNSGPVPGMIHSVMTGGDEPQRGGADFVAGRGSNSQKN
ncbi:hypothetical protein RJT34_04315 [Clitoria ternatea]|uniref:PB1 domain-containing protein n=1 Tax=Clitoria ternatea TaxID=43366 RepID=A0AAN9Q2I6_CLITE